jgi:quinol monooxygenase YgiN
MPAPIFGANTLPQQTITTRINHFQAKSGQGSGLRQFLGSVIDTIRTSPGCQSIQFLEAIDNPEKFAIVEVWDSVESHEAAAKAIPPAKLQEAMTLLVEAPTGIYFRVIRDAR